MAAFPDSVRSGFADGRSKGSTLWILACVVCDDPWPLAMDLEFGVLRTSFVRPAPSKSNNENFIPCETKIRLVKPSTD